MAKHLKSRPFTDPRDTWQNRARQSAEAKTGKVQDAAPRRKTGRIVDSNNFVYVDRVTYSMYNNAVYHHGVGSVLPLYEFNPGDAVECEDQVRVVSRVESNIFWGATVEFAENQTPTMAYARDCKLVGGPW